MAGKQPAGLRSLRTRRAPPARMDRDGERNSPHPARNSQACYPIKLSSAYLPSKTSLRKQPSHHCAAEGPFTQPSEPFTCPRLNIARIGCTTCPHQPFFRSQPYRRADRVRDCDACDRRSNPLPPRYDCDCLENVPKNPTMEMRKCAPVLLGEAGVTFPRHTTSSLASRR